MQQIGKGSELPERVINRRVDFVADPFGGLCAVKLAADPHQAETRGNQMLTGRIVEIGSDPLLNALLKRQQASFDIQPVPPCGGVLEANVARLAMAADQPDDTAGRGIQDRRDRRFLRAGRTTKRQPLPDPDLSLLREARPKCFADRSRVIRAQAIEYVHVEHVSRRYAEPGLECRIDALVDEMSAKGGARDEEEICRRVPVKLLGRWLQTYAQPALGTGLPRLSGGGAMWLHCTTHSIPATPDIGHDDNSGVSPHPAGEKSSTEFGIAHLRGQSSIHPANRSFNMR
ncbi:hypothetical protein ABIA09_003376 [Bradyrhizobium yuanmingense]